MLTRSDLLWAIPRAVLKEDKDIQYVATTYREEIYFIMGECIQVSLIHDNVAEGILPKK